MPRKTRLLNEQKKAKIRALEGTMPIHQIAQTLHHSWMTVKKVLSEGKAPVEAPVDAPEMYPLPAAPAAPKSKSRRPLTEKERADICKMAEEMSFTAIREVTGRSWDFIKKVVNGGAKVKAPSVEDTVALANEALTATREDPVRDAISAFRQRISKINPEIRIVHVDILEGTATVQMTTIKTIKLSGGLL